MMYGVVLVEDHGQPTGHDFWLIGWSRPTLNGVKRKLAVYSCGHPAERLSWRTLAGATKVAESLARDGSRWEVRPFTFDPAPCCSRWGR